MPTPGGPSTNRSVLDPPTVISGDTGGDTGADSTDLVTAPMKSLHHLTHSTDLLTERPNDHESPETADFIARGSLTVAEADYLFSQARQDRRARAGSKQDKAAEVDGAKEQQTAFGRRERG